MFFYRMGKIKVEIIVETSTTSHWPFLELLSQPKITKNETMVDQVRELS